MTLIAKPILKDQLWVIVDGQRKVGNVEQTKNGYSLKLGDNYHYFDSTKSIQKMTAIEFERPSALRTKTTIPFAQWPTQGKTYNNMFDVKRKIHIYTKTKKSRCFFAAGWYSMKLNDARQIVFCPKYILIQRYEYDGPYMSKEEAENS